MMILGIETSCDDTAAALLEIKKGKTRILSSIVSSQVKLHAKYGGVFPSLAAREHVKNLPGVLNLALKTSRRKPEAVDLIAVTHGPGLVSSLLVGTAFAQTLAWKYKKPIVGVNHLEGHIASNWLSSITLNSKLFPAICLVVSGGHTELVLMASIGKYKIIGQTLDDAAGEAFDKIARILGLGYPGGPAIAAEAVKLETAHLAEASVKQGNRKPETGLPRPMIHSKDFNFSFSGLKTAVLYLVRDLTKTRPLSNQQKTAIASEAQLAIVDVLAAKTIMAAKKYRAKSIMLSGGVSANKLLRSELGDMARSQKIKFFRPEMDYTTDNAAMIALAGYWNYKSRRFKKTELSSVTVNANLSI